MTAFSDLSYTVAGGIARVAVCRPDRRNAYRNETADQLRAALALAEDDRSVRCVVMAGDGRAFGAGYDLSTIAPDEVPALDQVLERHFNPLVRQMRASRLPIVASVEGACAGAAVGIALAADIVIAARTAFFLEPFVGIALVPDVGNTQFLTRMLGRVRASGMMLLGDRISADEAREWGLVWQVVEAERLADHADAVAARLASLSPAAIAATKRLIDAASEHGLADQLARERDLQGELGRSPEMRAAIAAFFAGRKEVR